MWHGWIIHRASLREVAQIDRHRRGGSKKNRFIPCPLISRFCPLISHLGWSSLSWPSELMSYSRIVNHDSPFAKLKIDWNRFHAECIDRSLGNWRNDKYDLVVLIWNYLASCVDSVNRYLLLGNQTIDTPFSASHYSYISAIRKFTVNKYYMAPVEQRSLKSPRKIRQVRC